MRMDTFISISDDANTFAPELNNSFDIFDGVGDCGGNKAGS